MTAILPSTAGSLLGKASFYLMSNDDHEWRHQSFGQMPTLTSQWPDQHGSRMGGMQDIDLSVFQTDDNHYTNTYRTPSHLISPGFSYDGDVPQLSPGDVEMYTPSTATFASEDTQGYFPPNGAGYLRPPTSCGNGSSTQSPKSAHSNISPKQQPRYPGADMSTSRRPGMSRSVTAPEATGPAALKRSGTSEDDDEEYVPKEEGKGNRGRKRQRIPHTAVERRYRENLNAHLDRLRQCVPVFASRTPVAKSGGVCQENGKPSKCEILNGAIEHIAALDKENQLLREEVDMLRATTAEMERWHRNSSRTG
ncbi:hypothetical protein LTR10_000230 [Elasticomyces elasticus]|nr:hypothetical protein LTR10_000230 [Elasticomyces elasticus]KAK4980513.1 hypothetical protein LTR42_000820 [Elasticomyces elasticus]